jgi:hypothetical protein
MKMTVEEGPPLHLPLMRFARGERFVPLDKGDDAPSAARGLRRHGRAGMPAPQGFSEECRNPSATASNKAAGELSLIRVLNRRRRDEGHSLNPQPWAKPTAKINCPLRGEQSEIQ